VPRRLVLDASALLALFLDEPGGEKVQVILREATVGEAQLYMSMANLGEVLYTVELRANLEASQEALGSIDQSPIQLIDIDRSLALLAARTKAAEGMGYLDCFVVATALKFDAGIVTQDPDFKKMEGRVTIEWLPAEET